METNGKLGIPRVISSTEIEVEASFEAIAKIRNIEARRRGTYVSIGRAGGAMLGSAEGLIISKEGEIVSFKGHGIGRFDKDGTAHWRGCMFYETQPTGKLAFLDNMVAVFEHKVFASGETTRKE